MPVPAKNYRTKIEQILAFGPGLETIRCLPSFAKNSKGGSGGDYDRSLFCAGIGRCRLGVHGLFHDLGVQMSLHTHDNRALFFIGKLYFHPDEIARDTDLSVKRKRVLLSDWASDRNAVVSKPALRRHPVTGAQVSIDEIIAALRSLDGSPTFPAAPGIRPPPEQGITQRYAQNVSRSGFFATPRSLHSQMRRRQ